MMDSFRSSPELATASATVRTLEASPLRASPPRASLTPLYSASPSSLVTSNAPMASLAPFHSSMPACLVALPALSLRTADFCRSVAQVASVIVVLLRFWKRLVPGSRLEWAELPTRTDRDRSIPDQPECDSEGVACDTVLQHGGRYNP